MKVNYDSEVDVLTIELTRNLICESEEAAPGVLLDYDQSAALVSIEILEASKRIDNPYAVDHEIT